MTARLGGGPVRFGGRIDIEGYQPTRVDVTMTGENMRLRFPEGMRSLVDADLTVQGPVDAPTLGGHRRRAQRGLHAAVRRQAAACST